MINCDDKVAKTNDYFLPLDAFDANKFAPFPIFSVCIAFANLFLFLRNDPNWRKYFVMEMMISHFIFIFVLSLIYVLLYDF